MPKAVVLLSGGMDSAVTLFMARERYECHALIFNYGQKAAKELDCARGLAEEYAYGYKELDIILPWKGSSLIDDAMAIPDERGSGDDVIPSTYVPSRNIIFLSYAASYAEAIKADAIFIGANQMDYSNYPDCRDIFYESFQGMLDKGTKRGVEGDPIKIETPIIGMYKKEIALKAGELGVPLENTWSCYADGDKPCMECESCSLRAKGFAEAGVDDPLIENGE